MFHQYEALFLLLLLNNLSPFRFTIDASNIGIASFTHDGMPCRLLVGQMWNIGGNLIHLIHEFILRVILCFTIYYSKQNISEEILD